MKNFLKWYDPQYCNLPIVGPPNFVYITIITNRNLVVFKKIKNTYCMHNKWMELCGNLRTFDSFRYGYKLIEKNDYMYMFPARGTHRQFTEQALREFLNSSKKIGNKKENLTDL